MLTKARTNRIPVETSIEAELPWLQLLPEDLGQGVVVLKSGAFMAGFDIDLVPYECVVDEELEQRSANLDSFFRTIPEECEVQFEVVRDYVRPLKVPKCYNRAEGVVQLEQARRRFLIEMTPPLENRVTMYLTWEPGRREPGKFNALERLVWPVLKLRDLRAKEHVVALRDFRGRIQCCEAALAEAGLSTTHLDNQTLIHRLRQSVNASGATIGGQVGPWENVSDRVALEDILVDVKHMQFGDIPAALLSMKSYPDAVFAYCLHPMARLPFPYRLHFGVNITSQVSELEKQQNRLKWAFAWTSTPSMSGAVSAPDKGAQAKAQAHNAVVDAMIKNNSRLVPVAVNALVPAEDQESLEKRVMSLQATWAQAMKGSELLRERLGSFSVWKSMLPGNLGASGRTRRFLSPKAADMLSGLVAGNASHGKCGRTTFYDREGGMIPVSVFETGKDQQARNVMLFGAMGGGKSMTLGNLILGEMPLDPMVRIVDIGGSTRLISELLGGVTQRFSLNARNTDVVNPCDFPVFDEEALGFLLDFVTMLITKERDDGLDQADEGRLAKVLRQLYDPAVRQGKEYILSDIEEAMCAHPERSMKELGARLGYITNGPYGNVLNRRSTRRLDDSKIVYYEFQDIASDDRLTRILMFAVTRDVLNMAHRVGPTVPKILALDEAWRILASRAGGTLVDVGARTARKLYMSFIVCSQSLNEFNTRELRASIINNCETQFLLKCSREDFRELASCFKLNEAELDLIRSLTTRKGEFSETFCIRPKSRQVLRLRVPPLHYWVLTTDPPDREARDKAFDRFDGDQWKALRWLAQKYPHGMEHAGLVGAQSVQEEVLEEAA